MARRYLEPLPILHLPRQVNFAPTPSWHNSSQLWTQGRMSEFKSPPSSFVWDGVTYYPVNSQVNPNKYVQWMSRKGRTISVKTDAMGYIQNIRY